MSNRFVKNLVATTLAMSLLIGGTLNAFADSPSSTQDITTEGTHNVTVTTKSGGTSGDGSDEAVFVLRLPASVELSRDTYTTFKGTYTVGVKGVLPNQKYITACPVNSSVENAQLSATFSMVGRNSNTSITAKAVQSQNIWANSSQISGLGDKTTYAVAIDSDNFVDITGTITTTVTVADEYTGTLGFLVSIDNAE